jgi:TBC1 domain family protein 5
MKKKNMDPKILFDLQRNEYQQLFNNNNVENVKNPKECFYSLRSLCLSGGLAHAHIRSLAWKVFLGCLPLDIPHSQWPNVIKIHRKEYSALLKQYLVDPHIVGLEMDPQINNPLSEHEESPWMKFFENVELEKLINQDIDRTYPENEFFQRNIIKEMMLRILFIYARQTPQLSYKQGMHELLAPIIYVLYQERCILTTNNQKNKNEINMGNKKSLNLFHNLPDPDDTTGQDELTILLDANFLEHDAFTMFNYLMKIVKDWFLQDNNNKTKQKDSLTSNSIIEDEENTSPVVSKCRYIQNNILKEKDPILYNQLKELKVEPQLYMLRWVRLLLGREFHLEDLLILWDAMFAYDDEFILIDYICVAMLIYIREQLLNKDYTSCLKRLFKYPPVEDVRLFIEKAIALHQKGLIISELTNIAQTKFSHTSTKHKKEKYQFSDTSNKIQNKEQSPQIENANTIQKKEKITKSKSELLVEIDEMKKMQKHMANRLDRIIYSLQKEIMDNNLLNTDENTKEIQKNESLHSYHDAVLLSVAELKQIRDILTGLIADNTPKKDFDE